MRFFSAKVQNVAGFLASFAAAFNDLYRSSSSALLTSGVHSQTCLRGASYSLETVRCGIASMASQRRCLVKTPSTRDTPSTAPKRSERPQIRQRNQPRPSFLWDAARALLRVDQYLPPVDGVRKLRAAREAPALDLGPEVALFPFLLRSFWE